MIEVSIGANYITVRLKASSVGLVCRTVTNSTTVCDCTIVYSRSTQPGHPSVGRHNEY